MVVVVVRVATSVVVVVVVAVVVAVVVGRGLLVKVVSDQVQSVVPFILLNT